jgi:hypothetical protein
MKRRGISLMELMVVMSAASMIITTSALVLHKMMRVQEQTRYFFENERAVERLARQFRRDVHDADDVEVDAEASEIEAQDGDGSLIALIRCDDRAISYVRTAAGIVRTVHPGEGSPAHETFTLAPLARLTIEEESAPRTLTLTITSSPADFVPRLGERAPSIRETPVSMQVVAVVGRDAQYRNNPIVAVPSVASSQELSP